MPAARIAIGNGSCDILLAAGEALLEPGAELVYAWPSFSVYPHLAAASGARAIDGPRSTPRTATTSTRWPREITVATRLVIVCNPNNPTSTALPLGGIAAFLGGVPRHVCVILDEAYCEFTTLEDPDASIDLLARHPNLVLLRTFSKVYGLCGLRVGFALCGSEEFRVAVDQVRQPFFCNVAAQAAAIEALRHQDEVARRVERDDRRAPRARGRPRGSGSPPRTVRPTSCGSAARRGRRGGDRAPRSAERGVLVRAGRAAGPRGRAARHLRPPRGERALPAGAGRAALILGGRRGRRPRPTEAAAGRRSALPADLQPELPAQLLALAALLLELREHLLRLGLVVGAAAACRAPGPT